MRTFRSARTRARALAPWCLALGALVVAGLCVGTAQGQSRSATLIIARNIDDYVTNDPNRTYEFTSQMLVQSSYDTLVTVEAPDLTRIQPKLAERWEVSKEGTTYTFYLRKGVKFASGNPVTAHDVRFSFRRLKHLKDNPSFFIDTVKDVEVANDTTVKITISAPDASFLAALAAVQCGIVDSKTVTAQGGTDAEDAKDKDKATEWLNQNSAGSGPYRIVSFKRNEEAVLERNTGYWGPKPYFTRIIFKHVKDGTTQREMVERGDADVAQGVDADLVARIKPGPKIRIAEGLSMNQIYLAFNTKPEVSKELSDKRVRQAIAYAIDYDGIVKGLARGAGERPPAMIPLGLLGVDKAMARKRDVARARTLLADAGYPNGFAVTLSYWSAPLLGMAPEPFATKIQADLKNIGISATLEPKERTVWMAEYRAGKPQFLLGEWSPDFLDSDAWADAFYKKGGIIAKRLGYENPRATELVSTAKAELDPKKRDALYREVEKIALEDAPYVMLLQPKSYVGLNPAIKGYAFHPIWFVTLARLSR
ncbi:MAG: ABC transporter substrate-binding protein [Candidatus Rokubacteria bacterium]|nr:ABC transporter substrate-binding protein [Candidatus Rokubacteria bacterium]